MAYTARGLNLSIDLIESNVTQERSNVLCQTEVFGEQVQPSFIKSVLRLAEKQVLRLVGTLLHAVRQEIVIVGSLGSILRAYIIFLGSLHVTVSQFVTRR